MNAKRIPPLAAILLLSASMILAAGFGNTITYQGHLADANGPAHGVYQIYPAIYDASTGGAPLALGPTNTVTITNGLFTITCDAPAGLFDGNSRWMELGVRTNGAATYALLTPRQQITATPYAFYSPNAGAAAAATTAGVAASVANGAVTGLGIASGQVVKSVNGLRDDVVLASGANVTLTPSGQTLSLSSPSDWHATGNAGTVAGANFIGTTDNQPVEIKVSGQRVLRLEPTAGTPNVLGGSSVNTASAVGVTISGGGAAGSPNSVAGDYGTVGGGVFNRLGSNTLASTISGGSGNEIQANIFYGVIAGGVGNQAQGSNDAAQASKYVTIGGGYNNILETWSYYSTISGGSGNRMRYDADSAVIAGGNSNLVGTNSDFSVISGGENNVISNVVSYGVIPGGSFNSVGGTFGFAAGQRAHANHMGAFVWSDSSGGDFSSSANNQFLIRAAGGVGINKTNPTVALDVAGTVKADAFVGGTNSASFNGPVTFVSTNPIGIGTAFPQGALLDVEGDIRLNNHDLLLRDSSDRFHGLGWFGTGKEFHNENINGVVVYGADGGALGARNDSGELVALRWNQGGTVSVFSNLVVDAGNANTGGISPGLVFGSSSGEAITSRRTSGPNQYGIDFWSGFVRRMTISGGGNIGIGTTNPQTALHVVGTVKADSFEGGLTLSGDISGPRLKVGTNQSVTGLGATIGGGASNSNRADSAVIAGGQNNLIQTGAVYAVIGGGRNNSVGTNVTAATIAGGEFNQIQGLPGVASQDAFIGGGSLNVVEPYAYNASIVGGNQNTIRYDADLSVIAGGSGNVIGTNANASFIGAGQFNSISNNAAWAVVPGGANNTAGANYAFAAGVQAKANHAGSFVWSDPGATAFASTGTNQFLVRAAGGVGINTNNPAGVALNVAGTVRATSFEGGLSIQGATHVNDQDLYLRGGSDENHGLGWYGSGKPFAGLTLDGPALYGCAGGLLGTACSTEKAALAWDWNTRVTIDPGNLNSGSLTQAALVFGAGNTGEGIASKRASGVNQNGLDFYTGFHPRMSITAAGRVGVGTNAPVATLDVWDGSGANGGGGSIHVGSSLASPDPKLIYFGDVGYVYIGENGADDTLELKATRFYFNTDYIGVGKTNPVVAMDIMGSIRATNSLRLGSEVGTANAPSYPAGSDGLVVRRARSTTVVAGAIVARTDKLTLERDGTGAGLRISYPGNPGRQTVTCIGIDRTGAQVIYKNMLNNPGTGGSITVFSDAQKIVHYDISFGETFSTSVGHTVHAVLDRSDDTTTSDTAIVGVITSTFNQ